MKIHQILFFTATLLFSCQLKTNKELRNVTKLEITQLQDVNKVLWERIQINPDSVYIHLNGLDLVISGELDDYGFSPISLYGKEITGQPFRIEEINGIWEENTSYYYIFYEDVNFDGNKDIGFLSSYGATGNYWYKIWVFNANENKFIYDDYYSGMPSPIFDTLNKTIQVYYRMGACDETIAIIEKNIVKKRIYTENENTKTGSNCWCITETLIDSSWIETERKIIYQSLDRLYRNGTPVICGSFK
jgi:hypothetical protein